MRYTTSDRATIELTFCSFPGSESSIILSSELFAYFDSIIIDLAVARILHNYIYREFKLQKRIAFDK